MLNYLARRLLLFIPTLLVISLLTFFISVNAPGDPVEVMLNRGEGNSGSQTQSSARDKDYERLRHQLGLDLPLFYFSLTDATVPDTLHRISDKQDRERLKRLANEYGSWENVSSYYLSIKALEQDIFNDIRTPGNEVQIDSLRMLVSDLAALHINDSTEKKIIAIGKIDYGMYSGTAADSAGVPLVRIIAADQYTTLTTLINGKSAYRKYIPEIHWYGTSNQYHRWITGFLSGDFGISYQDKKEVSSVLFSAMGKTVWISLLSILLAYAIAIPLGIHSAVNKGTQKEKTITTTLFLLYSLPNFWIATMLVVFFCGGDYLSWFPTPGAPPIPDDAPLWYKISEGLYRMILPLFCWTYGSLAFISRQMRGGLLTSFTQDYIQTARAKGLNEIQVVRNHAIKNSLLPVITLFANIFPMAIAGSFVIENIFNIPGMGKLSLEALYARDYPVIFAVMMFTALLTMTGNLLADVFYSRVDPRISFSNKEN